MARAIVRMPLIVLTGLLALHARGRCDGLPVHGDESLLAALRSVQTTNRAGFRTGAMDVEVQYRVAQPYLRTHDLTGAVVWDGDSIYWEYEDRVYRDPESMPFIPGTNVRATLGQHGDVFQIHRPDGDDIFWPASGVANRYQVSQKIPELLRLRPHDVWFRKNANVRDWDAEWSSSPPSATGWNVVRNGNDRIVLERTFTDQPPQRWTASLAVGGNVILYQRERAADGQVGAEWSTRCEYDWAADGHGGWYLRELKRTYHLPDDSDDAPSLVYHLKVSNYDPHPDISPGRFTYASLNVPADVRVNVVAPDGRTESSGSTPDAQVTGERLDELGDLLRSSGFAAPKTGRDRRQLEN